MFLIELFSKKFGSESYDVLASEKAVKKFPVFIFFKPLFKKRAGFFLFCLCVVHKFSHHGILLFLREVWRIISYNRRNSIFKTTFFTSTPNQCQNFRQYSEFFFFKIYYNLSLDIINTPWGFWK